MIQAQGLTKRFSSFTAIHGVSFQVARGEIVGFLGPNGAGKSTTMRILAGVFPPSSGRALVGGHDVVADPLRARQVVGYFPERVALYADMTVREYLQYVASMKGVAPHHQANDVVQAMEACVIADMGHRLIGTLSKGYRQRVGIAQALVGQPQVLILDEPTAGLDPEQVSEIRKLIQSLRGRGTVILSTHILSEVEATCDRVIIINKGHIRAVDTPRNLNQKLRRLSQIHLEVQGPAPAIADRLRAIPGVVSVEVEHVDGTTVSLNVHTDPRQDLRGALAATVMQAGWVLLEQRPVLLSLEDIFLSLVHESPVA